MKINLWVPPSPQKCVPYFFQLPSGCCLACCQFNRQTVQKHIARWWMRREWELLGVEIMGHKANSRDSFCPYPKTQIVCVCVMPILHAAIKYEIIFHVSFLRVNSFFRLFCERVFPLKRAACHFFIPQNWRDERTSVAKSSIEFLLRICRALLLHGKTFVKRHRN